MGIRRLSQDLLSYAELAVLGVPSEAKSEAITIQDVIVDGPSLVYWVYNKLVAYLQIRSVTSTTRTPSYTEINRGVLHTLEDIDDHGISIHSIFFDGGLPVSKREVRLERMEKLRQQLETFRKLHPEFPTVATFGLEDRDFEQALWHTALTSTPKLRLPPPPFMVASVIEALRLAGSKWKQHVTIVSGEADIYCALAARESSKTVAVLTNDSDLAVHDLGKMGRVALLHTLEKKSKQFVPTSSLLTALSLNPRQIAAKLEIPSLLALGFQRSLDTSASLAVLRERARSAPMSEECQDQYNTFAEEFSSSLPHTVTATLKLDDMDPRTAELIVNNYDSPSVYLTPVLEDPQRDSSWTYGIEIRNLAYSLVMATDPGKGRSRGLVASAVTEYARKGQRITPTLLAALDHSEITIQAAKLQSILAAYLQPADLSTPLADDTVLLAWQALAVHFVHKGRAKLNKTPPGTAQVVRIFGLPRLTESSFETPTRVSWDDVHLQANIQAVLYSLRMLFQIAEHILNQVEILQEHSVEMKSGPDNNQELLDILRSLHKNLSRLPPIADLFVDIPQLRLRTSKADLRTRSMMIKHINNVLAPASEPSNAAVKLKSIKQTGQASAIEHTDGDWVPAESRKKRKKRQRRESTPVSASSMNTFSVLSDDAG